MRTTRKDDSQFVFDRSWRWKYPCKVDEYQGDRQVRRPGGLLEVLAIPPRRDMNMEPGSVKQSDVRLSGIQNGSRKENGGERQWPKPAELHEFHSARGTQDLNLRNGRTTASMLASESTQVSPFGGAIKMRVNVGRIQIQRPRLLGRYIRN